MDFRVKVLRVTAEAQGIVVIELSAFDGTRLPEFAAGSHIDVRTPSGAVRQYSLCNPPGSSNSYVIAVQREDAGRGGSMSMHERLRPGDVLEVSAPKNHFNLAEDAKEFILFAGGIGITPIIAMADRLNVLKREFVLHYATRSPERTAFAQRLRSAPFAGLVHFHHSGGDPRRRLDLSAVIGSYRAQAHIYVCGPRSLVESVRAAATDAGWADSQVHFEYFGNQKVHSVTEGRFEVVIRSTGHVIQVGAAESVTEALKAHGVLLPTSCEQGVCGTCLTRVLEGEVDHRDLFLTPQEQAAHDQFLPCCSRSHSPRLVLDL